MARKPDRRDLFSPSKDEENETNWFGNPRAGKASSNERSHGTKNALAARVAKAVIRGHGVDDGKKR